VLAEAFWRPGDVIDLRAPLALTVKTPEEYEVGPESKCRVAVVPY
jgi:hypothetical protein